MGNPYDPVTVTSYNDNPPSDDGANTVANEVEWAKHKVKLGDPLKTAIETTQTNITAAFAKRYGNDVFSVGTNHTVTLAQEGRMLEGTATLTFTLPASGTAGSGFLVGFANTGTGTVTIDPESTETINGSTTIALSAQEYAWISSDGTNWTLLTRGDLGGQPLPRAYLAGLTLSNGTDTDHDINIAVGEARDTNDSTNLIVLTAIGKQLDAAFATGGTTATPTGGLSSSLSIANSTTYHGFIGEVSGTVEVGFDTSVTGSNLVTDHSFENLRRIGSVVTDGSANIRQFFQEGDHFFWVTRTNDYNASSTGTSAVTRTLTVPIGLELIAHMNSSLRDASASTSHILLVTSLDATDSTPTATVFTNVVESNGGVGTTDAAEIFVKTNTSGQIRTRNSASAADINTRGGVIGWIDTRGKNA